jgi:hypothetical protein
MATVQKRKNSIASLWSSDGVEVHSHEGKAALLLDSYKERLGRSEPTQNSYDFPGLLQNVVDLSFLDDPFSHKEIDDVVKDFPSNKSPGPDGFNAEFL